MSALDWIPVAMFLGYVTVVGLRERARASRSLEDYFLAGRSLGGWSAGLSMSATQFAADTPLVVTGLLATAGVFGLWRMWIYAFAFLLLGFVLARAWRRSGVITDAELTELRYGSRAAGWLRTFKALYFGTVFNCTVLAMVLLAATRIAEPFLPWHEWLPVRWHAMLAALLAQHDVTLTADSSAPGVWQRSANNALSLLAVIVTTLLYSTTGGLRAVVRTDFVQFVLAMLATGVFAYAVLGEVGGLDGLRAGLRATFDAAHPLVQAGIAPSAQELLAFTPDAAREAGPLVLTLLAVQWLAQMNADGTGYLAQRCLACRSDRDARLATIVFAYTQVLLRSLLWLPIGLGLLLVFQPGAVPDADAYARLREATYADGAAELLGPGFRGLMLVGLLAALCSTVDSHLNWGASYWTNDLYLRYARRRDAGRTPDARTLVRVARLSNGVILLLALVVMMHLGSLQQAWRISLLLGAGMGVILVLRWLWWRISAWGELAGSLASLLLAPLLLAFVVPGERLSPGAADALRLLALTLGATTTGIVVSLLTPESPARLADFYRRADPPGWWAPVARACGADPAAPRRRLARGLLATITAACSVFALLVGLGSWLVGGTVPGWWPAPPASWSAANVGLGLVLLPVWHRLGFGRAAD